MIVFSSLILSKLKASKKKGHLATGFKEESRDFFKARPANSDFPNNKWEQNSPVPKTHKMFILNRAMISPPQKTS